MKKKVSLFLSVIMLLLVINPATVMAKNQTGFLSKAKMLKDYDTMWTIIEENYPYMEVAKRVTGNDFNKVKATYRQYIKEGTTKKEFKDIIYNCLDQFNGTGQMGMLYNDDVYAYNLSVFKNIPGHCQLVYNNLNNKLSMKFYNYNKKKADITSYGSSSNTVNFTTKEYNDIQTAYIKIPGFNNTETNVAALKQYFSKISDYKYCILDLRGNTGGSTNYWIDGIVQPNLKEDISVSYKFLAKGDLSRQYIESDNTPCLPISCFDYSAMTNINLNDVANMDYYYEYQDNYMKASNPLFKGNFYVLIDKYNSNASEFIQFCKRSGFAKIVGETTNSREMGKDAMLFSLPNSGLCFYFSSLYTLNTDGSCPEEQGIKPDIEYTSLDFCLDLIKNAK